MAVVWEDNFHDTSKIKASTDLRIIQATDAGIIKGDSYAFQETLETLAAINAFFDTQTIAATCTVSSTTPPKELSDNAMKWAFTGAGLTSLRKRYFDGGTPLNGWGDARPSVYVYVDSDILQAGVDLRFTVQSKTAEGSALTYGIRIDVSVNATNFLVDDGLNTWTDSGIPLPTSTEWVKLTIELDDGTIYYHVERAIIGDKMTSVVSPLSYAVSFPIDVTLYVDQTAGVMAVYWDNVELETHLEQNDDSTNYPDHQQQYETININPSNWYQWNKINLSKVSQSIPNEKFISVSVLDQNDSGAVLSGYENVVDDEIDISGITTDNISLLIKFWSVHSYESPILEKLEVSYFTTGGEVTLAVTANDYNDDITTPVTTKTGYRITFQATAATPSDPDLEVTHYWFDFGDGLNTGWITNNIVNHVYNKHSQTVSEAGADQEWNARVKVKFKDKNTDVESVSGWSNYIDFNVLNSNPVARLWPSPVIVRMSGAGPSASVTLFGDDSYDVDDNGNISTSGGYKFDLGEGDPEVWQDDSYITNVYTVAGTYVVGLTVKDDLNAESTKITTRIRILPALAATLLVFHRTPRQADIDFDADLQITKTIAGGYPDVEPTTALNKTLKIIGQGHTREDDITLMKGYLEAGTLVQFNYVDLDGVTQNFTGYIKSLRTGRRGGFKDDVPWSATIQYKAV